MLCNCYLLLSTCYLLAIQQFLAQMQLCIPKAPYFFVGATLRGPSSVHLKGSCDLVDHLLEIQRVSILIAFQEDEPLVKVLSCNSILLILSVFFLFQAHT